MNVARILALCATPIAGGTAAAFLVGSPCATAGALITRRDDGTGNT
jgi:hypothetical protein